MAKLHELLAVDGNRKSQTDKTRSDLMNTFEKKRHHFSEKVTTFEPKDENAERVREEQLDMQTTVRKELAWLQDIWAGSLDVAYQIAETNTAARADVVLDDGSVLLKQVPTTALLELEKRAGEIHDLIASIPTLDPAKGFRPDADRGEGVYVAREELRSRTKKVQEPLVLAPPTDKHPAQVQLITKDVEIGTLRVQEWSGLLTVAEKGDMLERAERMRRAIKQARARANETEAKTDARVGNTLLDYVFHGRNGKQA